MFSLHRLAFPAAALITALALSPPGGQNPAQNRATPPSLNGPGIIRATVIAPVKAELEGQVGTVTFPIPGLYREQAPLSFELSSTPLGAIKGFRWRKRSDGLNWLCDVYVSPGKKGAIIKWEGLILVRDRPIQKLPPAAKPEVNKELEPWLKSTSCVQWADPAIRAQANLLAKGAPDIETYARRVIQFTSTNQGKPGLTFDALDARRALDVGGSCTSRANLAAALLRAHGIPARTLSHLPTWSGPLYEHWLVEYWHPGVGWVWVESTLGQVQPQPWTLAVLSVSSPEDENKAFDPLHLRYVMPGAAYLSVIELSKELYPADLVKDDATNIATAAARIAGSPEEINALFETARQSYKKLSEGCETGISSEGRMKRILVSAKSGKAADLAAALMKE